MGRYIDKEIGKSIHRWMDRWMDGWLRPDTVLAILKSLP